MKQLKKLVLKPTILCYHNCSYCHLRQEFYHNAKYSSFQPGNGVMAISQALRYVREAYELGMRECLLSGGDPLRYPYLVDLVRNIKNMDAAIFVFINSVGENLTYEQAIDILNAGLGAWNFSVDTLDAKIYDEIRGVRGGLMRVLDAFNIIRCIREEHTNYHGLWINFMAVLTRHNYRTLPKLFRFSIENKVSSIFLMNVYGDNNFGRHLLSVEQIREFRSSTIPEILDVLESSDVDRCVIENARTVLSEYFSSCNSDENYASGIWWKDFESVRCTCRVPDYHAMIGADGNVLPCCLIEIAHEGIVGNVNCHSLDEVWNGSSFEKFRRERIPFCQKCSAPLHRTIGLVPEMCRQFDG